MTTAAGIRTGSATKRERSLVRFVAVLAVLMAVPVLAQAQRDWVGGTGQWNVGTNWSPNSVPGSFDEAYFSNNAAATISTGTAAVAGSVYLSGTSGAAANLFVTGGSLNTGSIDVGASEDEFGGLSVSGGSVTTYTINVGETGIGTMSLTGGSVTVNSEVRVGNRVGSLGALTIDGGTLSMSSRTITVGANGTGTLDFKSGSISSGQVIIGEDNASVGNSVLMSGGTWTAGAFTVASRSEGSSFSMSAGSLTSASATIAANSNSLGVATVSGGTWTTTNALKVGDGGTGTLTASAGTVKAGSVQIGANGVGHVTVTGGSMQVANRIEVGGISTGGNTLDISNGGTLTSDIGNVGYFTSNEASLTGFGSKWVNAGSILIGTDDAANNTLTVANGALLKTGTLEFSSLAPENQNFLRLNGGFLALGGDQSTSYLDRIAGERIQIWDGADWVTATLEDLSITYYTNDLAGAALALADTGYAGLQNFTVITTVPEPGTFGLLGVGAGALFLRRRCRV